MDLTPRTVLIPLATGKANSGRIARVQADGLAPTPNAAGLSSPIADLSDWGLYPAGAFAVGAIQRLQLPRRGIALAQRLGRGTISSYLRVTNGPDLLGLTPENSRSAELGLALAVLMHAGQSRDRLAIATGALARDPSPNAPIDDVAVDPVGGIASKIEALVTALNKQRGGAYAPRVLFLLPALTLEGDPTSKVYAAQLSALKAAFAERGVEIEIAPVSSLREATSKLGITALESTPTDRLLIRSGIAGIASIILACLAYLWLTAPLKLGFSDVELSDGQKVPSPVRAVYDAQSAVFVMRPSCVGAQKLPVYQQGESLVLKASLRNSRAVDRILGGYHYAILSVSERSGIKVFPPQTIGSPTTTLQPVTKAPPTPATSPSELSLVLPVEGPTEKNKLIILARRLRPFDANALRTGLETALIGASPAERINVAVTYLSGSAPGYLDYSFLSAEGDPECQPR